MGNKIKKKNSEKVKEPFSIKKMINAYTIASVCIFIFMLVYFMGFHPLYICDTDDWYYVRFVRRSIFPSIYDWNPAKVAPETIMPIVMKTGAIILTFITKDVILSMAISSAIFFSVLIVLYLRLIVDICYGKKDKNDIEKAILLTFVTLIHFTIFKINKNMFSAANVTNMFNYVLPYLINTSLVMFFMKNNDSFKKKNVGTFRFWIVLVITYFAIYSNLFESVILAAYSGMILIGNIPNYKKIKYYIRDNMYWMVVELGWVSAMYFDYNGGRSASVGGGFDISSSAKAFVEGCKGISPVFAAGYLLIIIISIILISRKGNLKKYSRQLLNSEWKKLVSTLCVFAFLLLLCAASYPGYMGRNDVMIGYIFFLLIIMIKILSDSIEVNTYVKYGIAVLSVIMLISTITRLKSYSDYNMCGGSNATVKAMSDDIVKQIVEAEKSGAEYVELHVPDFGTGDNFPIANYGGDRISASLYECKVIPRFINVVIVPDNLKNAEIGF